MKNFKKGLIYVFVANIFNLFCSLVTGFVLPKFLNVDTYGNIKLFQLYITYSSILNLGYAEGMYLSLGGKNLSDIDKDDLCTDIKTYRFFQVIISFVFLIITIIMRDWILVCCALVLFPVNMTNYFKLFYQATGMFNKYSKITTLNTLMLLFVNLSLLFFIKDNSYYYLISYAVIYFLFWIILELEFKKIVQYKSNKKFDKSKIKKNIREGFSLMLGNFGTTLFTSIDRLFVKNLLGLTKFAYYSFAVSLENLLNAFVAPFSVTLYNYFCKHKHREDIIFLKRIILLFASFLIIFSFPAKFIIENFITKYNPSISILFILFMAQFFSINVKCIYNNLYKSQHKQKRYFKVMLLMIIISISFNIIGYLIYPKMEILAIATLIVNIIWMIVNELDFKEYKFNLKEVMFIIFIMIAYFISAFSLSSIIGGITYILCFVVFSILFMNNEVRYIILQLKKIIIRKKVK